MSANVSVGYTPQTTDIFVCRRHVGNVVPTRQQYSVMSAIFFAVGVVSVRPIADTHLGVRWVFPPPFFYFGGKLKIPKSENREEKETDHRLTTPPFPSLSFFNAR